MTHTSTQRAVQCYHCRRCFPVAQRAMSCSCPHCYKRVTIDDLVVSEPCFASRLQTCGRLTVDRKARLVASLIEARLGIDIQGIVEGKVMSGGRIVLGSRAVLRGDLIAPSIWIEPGAVVAGGLFHIDPSESDRVDRTEPDSVPRSMPDRTPTMLTRGVGSPIAGRGAHQPPLVVRTTRVSKAPSVFERAKRR